MASNLTVSKLLKLCAKRPPDEAAWQEFLRRYHHVIKANVVKTFHRKVREEAERRQQFPEDLIDDLVQLVYIRLVEDHNRALKRFAGEHENSIYQYLGMISINVVLDHFREARAQKRPKLSFSLDELLENSGDGIISESAISRIDGKPARSGGSEFSFEEIETALKRAVSGRHRERDLMIFKLRFYEGLTLTEIKQMMNLRLSPVSVGSILNRIIVKMKPLLGQGRGDAGRSARH